MIVSNTHSAVNLLFNGGFELKSGQNVPFWAFDGFDTSNSYELDGKLKLTLDSGVTCSITQEFVGELLPSDKLQSVILRTFKNGPEGYRTTENRVIPGNTPYSLAFSVEKEVGNLSVRPFYVTSTKNYLESQVVTVSTSTRLVFQIPAQNELIHSVGIEFSSSTAGTFTIDKVSMSAGQFSELPYLGDPFQQIFPEDCVIMTIGDTCPVGFELLDESRKGKLVRNSDDAGSDTHSLEDPEISLKIPDRVGFEGREGRLYDEFTKITGETPPTNFVFSSGNDNPPSDRPGDHGHRIEESGSIPVSMGLTLCKRV